MKTLTSNDEIVCKFDIDNETLHIYYIHETLKYDLIKMLKSIYENIKQITYSRQQIL